MTAADNGASPAVPHNIPPPAPGPGVIVAKRVLVLDHVPPMVALDNAMLLPVQTAVGPRMRVGLVATVAKVAAVPHVVKFLIVVVPPAGGCEEIAPVVGSTVATLETLLVHVPVVLPLFRVVVPPRQIKLVAGNEGMLLTVTGAENCCALVHPAPG